uniref:Glutathione peroxidase 1 n=1 Tax=Homo sapiens TaxID=9606 RepID=A0A7I2UQ36_HUMAN
MCAARLAAAAAAAQSVYAFSARPLAGGEPVSLGSLRGKVLLIENVASLCGTTVRDYTQMNELQRRLGPRGLVVLGFPCNQFGHQLPFSPVGERQERRDSEFPQVRPAWWWVRAQLHALREVRGERCGGAPSLRLPAGGPASSQRRRHRAYDRPQAHHLVSGVSQRCCLEL